MEKFEKVERLSKIANVSFEEARKALEENNWDLLDAMSALEKEGKTMVYGVQCTRKDKVRSFFSNVCRIMKNTSFHITKDFKDVCTLPLWVFALILFFAWHVAIIVLISGLFFGYRYSFEGQQDLSFVNKVMDDAGNLVDQAKNEFNV